MAVDGSLKFDTKLDSNGLEKGIEKIGNMAAKGMAVVTTALAGASTYAIKVGADFEEGMSKVSAISGVTGEELTALTEKAKEMGAKTKFSATESAEAMKYMAMAGWKSADMLSGIDGVMNLAAASGEELALVSDIVTDALTAFGLQAKDSAHFADVLAKASSNSNTNVAMMGATFKYAAPLAGALKYSIEDVALATGLMANAGIKGEQAGTALRSMFTRLAKPTDECAEAMAVLNISIKNADGSAKPLKQTLLEMRESFAKLTDTEKTQYASMIAGQEAMSGLLAIVNASESDFNKLASAINDSDGAAQEMAETMQDNLKGQIVILGSSLEGLGIQAYEKFEKPMKKAVQASIEKVEDLSKEMESGKLSKSLDTCADGLGTMAEVAIDLATDAIPLVIDGFAFIVDHGKQIVTTAGAIGGAMLGMKIADPVLKGVKAFKAAKDAVDLYNIKLIASTAAGKKFAGSLTLGQAAVGVLTGKVTLATAATTAWNAACTALGGPIGVLVTAIAAVGAGIVAYSFATRDSIEETNANVLATEKIISEYEKLSETLKTNKEARQDAMASSQAEIESADILSQKLDELSNKENKSNAEKEMMKYYVEELNNILPDLNLQYDAEKDALNMSTEAIRENITAQKELVLAKAAQQNLQKIAEDMASAEIALDKATQQHIKNEKALNAAKKETIKTAKAWREAGKPFDGEIADAYYKASNAEADLRIAYEKSGKTVDKYKDKVKGLNKEFDDTSKYAQTKLNSAGLQKQLDEMIANAEAQGIKIPQAVANGILEGKYALPQSVEEMKSLVNYDDLLKKTSDAGIVLPSTFAAGITSGEIAPSQAVKQMNNLITFSDLLAKSSAAGVKVPESLSQAILDGKIQPSAAVEQMKDLITYYDMVAEADAAGIAIPKEISDGVTSGKLLPAEAAKKLAKLTKDELNKIPDGMYSVGISAGDGLANGLWGSVGKVANAAADIIHSAIESAKRAQDSHSPSRVWRDQIGLMAGEGYAVGLDNSIPTVKKTIIRFADTAISTMSDGVKKMPGFNIKAIEMLEDAARMRNMRPFDTLNTASGYSSNTNDNSVKYEVHQTFNGNGPIKPSEAAREMQDTIRRMEWERK
ncbi:MAG: phage tail tape measure protein [Amedibacillus dolichus]|uniref:Phage tail tape measure protein n=1 Tax=Amedibacillus dolichus TaxID=31971 RepID=A0A942ZWI3_9FIRM|nr:phage tail tape measure protein [Amedibacillus dolichus]MBS4883259.1 phage tail tape measure protein [Amedibacillus dolichus]